jgi:hypothetical protein
VHADLRAPAILALTLALAVRADLRAPAILAKRLAPAVRADLRAPAILAFRLALAVRAEPRAPTILAIRIALSVHADLRASISHGCILILDISIILWTKRSVRVFEHVAPPAAEAFPCVRPCRAIAMAARHPR